MKLIELHILQSFPVSCLNRDDLGSPKTAIFGGVTRARISSQCLKRTSRMVAKENHPGFAGIRSRHLLQPFESALIEEGIDAEAAKEQAEKLCAIFSKPDKNDTQQVTTAVFLSPSEIEQIAKAVASGDDPKKAAKKATRNDAADIALFGRMIANDANLNIEGAAMFSHALSTHEANNELDFFTAVDDRKEDAEDAGAGMIGTLEYSSATYYRYIAVNLDLIKAPTHLGELTSDERKAILNAFLRAAITAVPNARKNSMNAATLPFEVLGIRKDSGQPLQLVNAFEKKVKSTEEGYENESLKRMKAHLEKVEDIWGKQGEKIWLTEEGFDQFVEKLLAE